MLIEIEDSNPLWEGIFHEIACVIRDTIEDIIVSIEHVGSTSVKGLAAKPILDMDIITENNGVLPLVIKGLEKLGYFHQENWSFEGREAFGRKDASVPWNGKGTIWMEHHLYVCNRDSKELARHLAFREYLRRNPKAVKEYDQLKRELAKVVTDRPEYTLGKSEFIEKILDKAMKKH